jgi:hypothetical protein
MRWLPCKQYMMNPIGVPFDKPIIQRMKPLNGILQIPAYYTDTGTIFRGRLYWFPLIHRNLPQPVDKLNPQSPRLSPGPLWVRSSTVYLV